MARFIELTQANDDGHKIIVNLDNIIRIIPNTDNPIESTIFFNVIFGGNGSSMPNNITVKENYFDIKDLITESSDNKIPTLDLNNS
ncbi:hypothetical protein SAMN05421856_101242 [Chryseobacterium taichungense]|uniref:Uncharacterized protein n=1 Tax=Chryseobacterium taichungense TaxID=295069 RepID=A0A1H7VTB5_9FLAO|nr:hypothetical protein [Chryseobacterium taichungense]SEM12513.1 hypothetical protein SAMN05421856_101242 [Chryseobacterium taichungense]